MNVYVDSAIITAIACQELGQPRVPSTDKRQGRPWGTQSPRYGSYSTINNRKWPAHSVYARWIRTGKWHCNASGC